MRLCSNWCIGHLQRHDTYILQNKNTETFKPKLTTLYILTKNIQIFNANTDKKPIRLSEEIKLKKMMTKKNAKIRKKLKQEVAESKLTI